MKPFLFYLLFFLTTFSLNAQQAYLDCQQSEMNLNCDLQDLDGLISILPSPNGNNPSDPICDSGAFTNSHWYSFASGSGDIEILITPSNCDTINDDPDLTGIQLSIWTGCPDNGGQCVIGSGNCNDFAVTLSGNLSVAGIYNLVIDGCAGSVCDYTIDIIESQDFYPIFDNSPEDLILNCIDPNNSTLIDDWIDEIGNATFINPCSQDIIVVNDYNGNIPDCGMTETVVFESFETEESRSANIIINSVPNVNFEQVNYNVTEGNVSLDVCLNITDESLSFLTEAEIGLLSSSTATNSIDHSTIPNTQTFQFPAGSSSAICYSIDIIDDLQVEPSETISFEILNVTLNQMSIPAGDINETTVFIIDNDDLDGDGLENTIDNCPANFNPLQEDVDNDGIGNICDSNNIVTQITEIQDNLFINKDYSGVIIKSLNGTCWFLSIDDTGQINSIPVSCP